jgi:MFS family permease
MQTRASLAAWYALAILSVAVLYAVMDRQVLILLAQPLKVDLGLSDTQIGSLQGLGAVLFSSIAVVPLGWLADKMDRRLLLALCILVWSVAVASCGLATSYWTLLLSVALLGAGEAGLSPIVFALIPELFPERQRMTANFIFYAATVLGAGAGIAIAGAVVQNIGLVSRLVPSGLFTRETWRLVFFVVAIPGPFLALAIGLIRLKRRAPRTRPDAVTLPTQARSRLLDHLRSNWKAISAVFVPYSLAFMGASAIFTWMPVILMRESGLSAGAVGAGLGGAITVGSVAGLAVAGVASKYLKPRWGPLTPGRLSQIGYLMYALLSPLYFLARTPDETFMIVTAQMAMVIGGNSLMPTLVQDLAPRDLRGRVFAISTVVVTLFQVTSPIAVGLLSDHVFTQAGGLLKASVFLAFPSILAAAFILRLAEKQILTTVERVRALSDETVPVLADAA